MNKGRFKLALLLITLLIIAGCERKPSREVVRILFEELAEAEDPYSEDVLPNNWRVFHEIEALPETEVSPEKIRPMFEAFFLAAEDLELEKFDSEAFDIMLEYSANLLRAVPEGGALLVKARDEYYLTRFVQSAKGFKADIPVINVSLMSRKQYRDYLRAEYSIDFPDSLASGRLRINGRWLVENLNRPVYASIFVPDLYAGERPLLGPGRLYGVELTREEARQRIFELYDERFSLEEISRSPGYLYGPAENYASWYVDSPLYMATVWMKDGDTTSVRRLSGMLAEKFPFSWKAANVYLRINPDLPPQVRREMLNRIRNWVNLHPGDKAARRTLRDLTGEGAGTGT